LQRNALWLLPALAIVLAISVASAQDKEVSKEGLNPVMAALPLNQPAPAFDVTNVKTQETKCYL